MGRNKRIDRRDERGNRTVVITLPQEAAPASASKTVAQSSIESQPRQELESAREGKAMLGVVLVITAIALAAFAGAVVLARFVAKGMAGAPRRGILLTTLFALAVFVADALASYLSVYYVKPIGWILAAAVSVAAAAAALFVTLGRGVRWKPPRVLALMGLGLVSTVLFGILAMALSGVVDPPLPYATRARQIAEANGFEVLMPPGERLQTESLPIEPLPAPDAGVSLAYEHFMLEERKAGSGSAKGAFDVRLRTMLTAEADEVEVTTATVLGAPALCAEYRAAPPEGAQGAAYAPKFQRETVLIFELRGVEVRLRSFSGERESGGRFVPFRSLTTSELAAIAGTLRPFEQ
ncbi:MAG: hypothetical protein C4521_12120 [Actinobacteria bacterium]|nr:MAG: hypothetical protein C4521_12120 [Actinomycetota bacterium]